MEENLKIKFMKMALKEARKAEKINEVPIGAVIVKDGRVVSKGYNKKEKTQNPLMHAEIIAIEKACKKNNNFRLEGCSLFVTVEPCLMCAGAIIAARIKNVYFGTRDEKYGAVVSVARAFDVKSNNTVDFEEGIEKEKCELIIKEFFKRLRNTKKTCN